MKKDTIVCLCGSSRFKEDFLKWERQLTKHGFIVLTPGLYEHVDLSAPLFPKDKERFDQLHCRKIAMSDEVFVIDTDNYIGDSTKEQIKIARALGIPVFYVSELEEHWF